MRHSLLFSMFVLFVIVLPCRADTIGETMTFRKIGIFQIQDQTGKDLGREIGEFVRKGIEETFRFEVIHRMETIKWASKPEEILMLSRASGVDLVVGGKVAWSGKDLILNLGLFEGKTGKPFALHWDRIKEWKKPEVLDHAVQGLVKSLISRIPYKTFLAEVNEKSVRLEAGTLHGVEKGLKAAILEIEGLKRHPFTNEVIDFQVEEIAQLNVTEVTERSSTAMILGLKKGKKLQINQKVQFHPSEAALARAEALKKDKLAMMEREHASMKTERQRTLIEPKEDKIGLTFQTGLLNNNLDFESNGLNFVREAEWFSAVSVIGDAWFLPDWGLRLLYRQSWLQFDQVDSNPSDVDATFDWFQAGIRYRYQFKKVGSSPALIAMIGYHHYRFQADPEDRNIFVDYRLRGPAFGLEGTIPFMDRFSLDAGFEYLPLIDLSEGSVNSGEDSDVRGLRIQAAINYKIGTKVEIGLGYLYEKYMADFSGIGNRGTSGVTGADSAETINGLNLNLTAKF